MCYQEFRAFRMNLASKVWPPLELCTRLLSTKLVDDNGWRKRTLKTVSPALFFHFDASGDGHQQSTPRNWPADMA